MTELTIAQAAANIAAGARVAVEVGGLSPEAALRMSAEAVIKNSREATARTGIYAYETTTEQIEAATFQGAVASMILNGASVPSVGNVGEYTLGLI